MRRLRQMVDTITERRWAQDHREKALLTWHTRTLAQFIAAYGGKDAIEVALKVSLIEEDPTVSLDRPSAPMEKGMNSTEALMMFAQGMTKGSGSG